MVEWVVDIQSMVPNGEIGERMVVAQVDERAGTYALMHTPMLTSHNRGEAFSDNEIFMRGGWSTRAFGKNEIDQFLQAMMDAGWKRGLRPVGFDPSAGELAAVHQHLEDVRKIALMKVTTATEMPAQAATVRACTEDSTGDLKKW